MKKILILVLFIIFISGCANINKTSVDNLIKEVQQSKLKLSNEYRTGYKYYLPLDLVAREVKGFNEIITYKEYKYYLYVDIISYFNKIESEYQESQNCYISKIINYKKKTGYLEVNSKNNKYLIEIMYNYAKIELIVDKGYLKEAITNALVILSTIKYNNDIIENMMGKDILNFNEEQIDIFKTNGGESNFLDYLQEYDSYEGDDVPDLDLIN